MNHESLEFRVILSPKDASQVNIDSMGKKYTWNQNYQGSLHTFSLKITIYFTMLQMSNKIQGVSLTRIGP